MTPLQLDAIISPPCAGVIRYFAPSPVKKNRLAGGSLGGGGSGSLGGGNNRSLVGGVVGRKSQLSEGSEAEASGEEWVLVLTVQVNHDGHVVASTTELSQGSGDGSLAGGSLGERGSLTGVSPGGGKGSLGGGGGSLGGHLLLAACEESSPHMLKATFTPAAPAPPGVQAPGPGPGSAQGQGLAPGPGPGSAQGQGLAQGPGLGSAQGLGLGLGIVGDPPETVLVKYVPLVVHPASTMILWPSPLPPLILGQPLSKRVHLNARLVLRNRGDLGMTHPVNSVNHTPCQY